MVCVCACASFPSTIVSYVFFLYFTHKQNNYTVKTCPFWRNFHTFLEVYNKQKFYANNMCSSCFSSSMLRPTNWWNKTQTWTRTCFPLYDDIHKTWFVPIQYFSQIHKILHCLVNASRPTVWLLVISSIEYTMRMKQCSGLGIWLLSSSHLLCWILTNWE